MEILSFDRSGGHEVTAFGSTGFAVQALVRAPDVAVTVLHVATGGCIGRHPATVDQLLLITAGRGRVQGGDGTWRKVSVGDAVFWKAGEEHVTEADEPITAIGIEMPDLPLRRPA